MQIGSKSIGPGGSCFIIAEVAQAHDGSLGTAHAYIDAAAKTGVDAIKFQTHIADAESTPGEPFRVKFSRQDASRYDYWKRMEFTPSQWHELAQHAGDVGLIFLSTPFSMQAVDLLESLNVAAWKVGSGELTTLPLLERMASTGRPMILSSGMANWEELDLAVEIAQKRSTAAVLQCTTAYPCPAEKIGLNLIDELRQRYQVPVGLSDHSGTIYAGLAAASLGANLLEFHIVFTRDCFGPDVPASLTIDETSQLVQGVRFIERALSNPLDKQQVAGEMTELKIIFGKSVVAARDLPSGHLLANEDLALKKPGTGIPATKLREVIGKRLKRGVSANSLLSEADID